VGTAGDVDQIRSIERVTGGDGNDTLIGNEVANVLNGFFGDDQIEGKGGDDRLRGGRGNDSVEGGDGTDTCNGRDGAQLRGVAVSRAFGPTECPTCAEYSDHWLSGAGGTRRSRWPNFSA
jgi:Ca2+-binding RTX toxin-like protein